MNFITFPSFKVSHILSRVFVFFYLFLSSCSTQKQEAALVRDFIQQFFFEGGAVYTLFGQKPMTDLLIFCGNEKDIALDDLSQSTLEQLSYQEDFTWIRWQAWCKFIDTAQLDNYVFVTRQSPIDPLYLVYGIVNVPLLEQVFDQFAQEFKAIDSAMTFSQALQELQQGGSRFWSEVFANHYLSGILYGYGDENAKHFSECVQHQKIPEQFSEATETGFIPLPVYAISGKDAQRETYQIQKERIEKIYQGRDVIPVTMQQLALVKKAKKK